MRQVIDTIEFAMDVVPAPKLRARYDGRARGRVYTPRKTVVYERELQIRSRAFAPPEPWRNPIALTITFFIKAPFVVACRRDFRDETVIHYPVTRPDLDNYLKAIMDAFNGCFWEDDSCIVEIHSFKHYTKGQPRIHVKMDKQILNRPMLNLNGTETLGETHDETETGNPDNADNSDIDLGICRNTYPSLHARLLRKKSTHRK